MEVALQTSLALLLVAIALLLTKVQVPPQG